MIAADSSSLINFFRQEISADVALVRRSIERDILFLPPPVVTEILSNPKLQAHNRDLILKAAMLKADTDIWYRAGDLRAKVIAKGMKAKLGDALIAQYCMDCDVPLIAADQDFRHYVLLGLRLAK